MRYLHDFMQKMLQIYEIFIIKILSIFKSYTVNTPVHKQESTTLPYKNNDESETDEHNILLDRQIYLKSLILSEGARVRLLNDARTTLKSRYPAIDKISLEIKAHELVIYDYQEGSKRWQ